MKATELKKGQIYTDIVDVKVPLMFTGKKTKQFDSYICYFTPVKTEENKNWFSSTQITIRFDIENGSTRIK